MIHRKFCVVFVCLIVFAVAVQASLAQKIAPPVTSLRVYLFDCGLIKGENPTDYGLNKDNVKNTDMVVPCYLIVHPKGTLMWDVGLIPDSAFKGDKPVIESDGSESSPKPLLPQLAALGYPPAEHHLHCLFALSFRSHRECERVRRFDLAGPRSRTRCDVRRQSRASSFLQSTPHQQDGDPSKLRLRCIRRWDGHHQIHSWSYSRPPGSGLETSQDGTGPDRGGSMALCGREECFQSSSGRGKSGTDAGKPRGNGSLPQAERRPTLDRARSGNLPSPQESS